MEIKETKTQSATVDSTQAYAAVDVNYCDKLAVQLNVSSSSSPVVTFKLQATLDNTNWVDVPGSSIAVTADGNHLIEFTDLAFSKIRAYFTRTSGSAVFEVVYGLKYN